MLTTLLQVLKVYNKYLGKIDQRSLLLFYYFSDYITIEMFKLESLNEVAILEAYL